MKKLKVVLVTLLLAVGLATVIGVVGATQAGATTSTSACGGSGPTAGWNLINPPLSGASGTQILGVGTNMSIRTGEAHFCTSNTSASNFTEQYIGVSNLNVFGSGGYAEVGVRKVVGASCGTYFAQYRQTATSQLHLTYGGCAPENTIHYFWIDQDSSCGNCMEMHIDNSTLLTTNFSPQISWTADLSVGLIGDAGFVGTDIPGNPAGRVDAYNLSMQTTYGAFSWVDACSLSPYIGFTATNSLPAHVATHANSCDSAGFNNL